jgi:hypothetical protein
VGGKINPQGLCKTATTYNGVNKTSRKGLLSKNKTIYVSILKSKIISLSR